MILQTIGFTKKSAQQFFDILKDNKTDLLLDIRLNNKSQLAGFTKGDDLAYFLEEICHCGYEHELNFAPSKEILDNYRDKKVTWNEYEKQYKELITKRDVCDGFIERYASYKHIVLLCSEPTPAECHRRLAAEMIRDSNPGVTINHL